MENTFWNGQPSRNLIRTFETDELFNNNFCQNNIDYAFIPNENIEDLVSDSENESEYSDEIEDGTDTDEIEDGTYDFVYDKYDDKQKLLEPTHKYKWIEGEHKVVY